MSDVVAVETANTSKRDAYFKGVLEAARMELAQRAVRSIQVMTELMETAENERVRLAAAESIADRAGLGKQSTTTVQVNQGEHEAARREAEDLVKRLDKNRGALPVNSTEHEVDSLIVLESE